MKISKLYSNKPMAFTPILFNDGFNVVLGDITDSQNTNRDTHNLGKTTLVKLLDFMLLAKRDSGQFLFKNIEVFKDFVFFLEIALNDGGFLTIRRSVAANTKISFKSHSEKYQDFRQSNEEFWDHHDVPLARAKFLLEGKLGFNVLGGYHYRKITGYLMRTQSDFGSVFKLNKHRGKDIDWKPYMADLLGFNGSLATEHYNKQVEVSKLKEQISALSFFDAKNASQELSGINNKILLRKIELNKLKTFVDAFNFSESDQNAIELLVSRVDQEIADKNILEYSLKNNINRIRESLNTESIKFNTEKVMSLFSEVNVIFPDQITKSFDQLIDFNKAITEERNLYLREELESLQVELVSVQRELIALNESRASHLNFLKETELVVKFKESNNKVSNIQGDIAFLEHQKETIEKILTLESNIKKLDAELETTENLLQENVNEVHEDSENIFAKIRIYFDEIISQVLDKEGSIIVFLNNQGNFEFEANYQNKNGDSTSEGDGDSYQKLLCIAFDLAVSLAYIDDNYPRFIYLDGALEGLDHRKKAILLEVLRNYSNQGLQIIITSISSEVMGMSMPVFAPEEIILRLHDNGQDGRLFKMNIW